YTTLFRSGTSMPVWRPRPPPCRPCRRLERSLDQRCELHVVEILSALAADEAQVFAVALSCVAEPQRRPALESHVPKNARFRQGREQMQMDRLLDEILLHLAWDSLSRHEGGDGSPKAGGSAVHSS